jgi:hypothetical protein
VTYSSLLPYYILLVAVLLIWVFAGIEVSSFLVVRLYTDQFLWFAYALSVMLAVAPILWAIARIMKRRVSFNQDMKWDYHNQELEYTEFSNMMADYASGYSHLISRKDLRLLAAALIMIAAAMILPVSFAAISVSLVFILPFAYGGLELVYGILLTSYFYRDISNEATSSCKIHPDFPWLVWDFQWEKLEDTTLLEVQRR